MPVLLSKENELETWLSGTPAEAFALIRRFDPAQMRIGRNPTTEPPLLL
jgi:hypothetical protein